MSLLPFFHILLLTLPCVFASHDGSELVSSSLSPQLTTKSTSWLYAVTMRHQRTLLLALLFILVLVLLVQQFLPPVATETIAFHQSILAGLRNTTQADFDFQGPLRTRGRDIINAKGNRIKLASINWYGASDIYFVPGGLNVRHRDEIAATIRRMGFNSVRFPYSDQMVLENPLIPVEHVAANMDLLNHQLQDQTRPNIDAQTPTEIRALDVFHACVRAMTDAGLAVIINDHITNAHWCDGKNLCDASWKNDHYGPICTIKQTTETWIDNWVTIMTPHVNNPLVIGADLRNEPRGLWGTMSWKNLAAASEKAAAALHQLNPNWLMFVEGISSSNDISGARSRPIRLTVPDRVVYSSHVYSWSGWSTFVPYSKRAYDSFARDMDRNWGYLIHDDLAPVWVGEFGGPGHADAGNRNYWNHLMIYLHETDADFAYWALNPRKPENDEFESYGLLKDDWETIVEDYRMNDLRRLMGSRT